MARRRQFNTGSVRKTTWIGGILDVPTNENRLDGQTAEIFASVDTRLAVNQVLNGATIVRSRGIFSACGGITTANNYVIGAYGVIIVSGEAFDAGLAALPTPWSESDYDGWLVHGFFSTMNLIGTSVGSIDTAGPIDIDSKAMRKLKAGDVIVWMMENASSDNVDVFWNFRQLVKLA